MPEPQDPAQIDLEQAHAAAVIAADSTQRALWLTGLLLAGGEGIDGATPAEVVDELVTAEKTIAIALSAARDLIA